MTDWSGVEQAARAAEADGGVAGVSVIAPGGAAYGYREHRRFVAASTVKIAILIAVERLIDAGRCADDDRFVVTAAQKSPGSGVLLNLHDGIELTLRDLIYLMISISDNTATNLLIDLAGMDRVNETMRSLGLTESTLGRPMRGRPALPEEAENWAVPAEYTRMVQAIVEGRAASPAACARMVTMLQGQQNPRRIGRHVPRADGITWGSKTGSVGRAVNDAGFITTPAGTLFVAVFTEDLPDSHRAEQAIGDITRAALAATGLMAVV
jgi:beta-lactamase class A